MDAANALLAKIAPLAQTVCDGYEAVYENGNKVAQFTDAAEAAIEKIRKICDDLFDRVERNGKNENCVRVWQAGDWLDSVGGAEAQAKEFGITAETSDDELEKISERLSDEARADGIDYLDGLDKQLEWIRDEIRKADEADELE